MSAAAETLRRSGEPLELIAGLMEEFAQTSDLGATFKRALSRIATALQAEAAMAMELEGDWRDADAGLLCRACYGPLNTVGLRIPARRGVVGRALARAQVQAVADVAADPDFVPTVAARSGYRVRSLLAAPMMLRGERLGVIVLINRTGGAPWSEDAAGALGALAAAAALAIVNARLTGELMREARLAQELATAAQMQRALLPPPQPDSAPLHGISLPARGVSGDFYDILPLPGGRTAFALADVSGKGVNAALVMVKVATLFRCLGKRVRRPGPLLARIESELCERLPFGMFVTMIVGVYEPECCQVRWANAGHPPPLLRHADGRWESFPARDPPLGVLACEGGGRYREQSLAIDDGVMYLYTDGCSEARDERGEELGVERLQALLAQHAGLPATARLQAVVDRLRAQRAELHDDLTLLAIEGCAGAHCGQVRRRGRGVLVAQTIAARPEQLKIVRRLVTAAARVSGADAEWAGELALAVDEACQNIIRHGYGEAADGTIELRVRRRGDALEVELVDFAPKVDSRRCRGRRLDRPRPGGLGTHFMRAAADRVIYRRPPPGAGNRLVLIKRLRGGAPA